MPIRTIVATVIALWVSFGALGCATSHAGAAAATADASGSLQGRVTLTRGGRAARDHSGVVVYLEGVPGELPDTSNLVHEIRQVDKTFLPEVSAVVKGTTISFPNDDRIFHNVFSVSRAARFDLGLYKSGTTKTVVMKRAGAVEVYCNIHPEMAAWILVLDTGWWGMTDRDGEFAIEGIPPGTYRFVAWQSAGKPGKGTVTIAPGETAELAIELTVKPGTRHLRKDGTPYGRYQ